MNAVEKQFSRAAGSYHRLATIQRKIAEQLSGHFNSRPQPGRILDIGCGTGFLTQVVREYYPESSLTAIDLSPAMIEQAHRYNAKLKGIEWIVGDFLEFESPTPFDLIVSSSALQWITPFELACERIHGMLKRDGRVVFSIVIDGTLQELNRYRREIAPRKEQPLPLLTEHQVIETLSSKRFKIHDSRSFEEVSYLPTALDLFRYLHDAGFNGSTLSHGRALNRRELTSLCAKYDRELGGKDGIPATWRSLEIVATPT